MRVTAASCSSPEHHHVALPGESEGKARSHQHHFLHVLGFSLQIVYSRLGWVLTSLGIWELNLVWLQISHSRVWFESCQCRDECYRKNKKSSHSCLFVCLRDSVCQMRGRWEVRALGAVTSFPSGPVSYQLAFSTFDICRAGFAFLLKHAMGFDKNDAEQSRDLGFVSIQRLNCFGYIKLVQCIGCVIQWVNGTDKDRKFLEVPCSEEQIMLPPIKIALSSVVSCPFIWFLTALPNWPLSRFWLLSLISLLCLS